MSFEQYVNLTCINCTNVIVQMVDVQLTIVQFVPHVNPQAWSAPAACNCISLTTLTTFHVLIQTTTENSVPRSGHPLATFTP